MSGDNSGWLERSNQVFINTYNRFPAVLVEGQGCVLKDADGREYLEFLAGMAADYQAAAAPALIVRDFIAGMTDDSFLRQARRQPIPETIRNQ